MKIKYVCEICEKEFDNEMKCKRHEDQHEVEEWLKAMPSGTVICPACKGKGWRWSAIERLEYETCKTCKGKKVVKLDANHIYHAID